MNKRFAQKTFLFSTLAFLLPIYGMSKNTVKSPVSRVDKQASHTKSERVLAGITKKKKKRRSNIKEQAKRMGAAGTHGVPLLVQGEGSASTFKGESLEAFCRKHKKELELIMWRHRNPHLCSCVPKH